MSKYRCIFCQSDVKLSREHIWADWLKSYIPRTGDFTDHLVSRGASPPQKGKLTRPGDLHSQRLQVVCPSCNSGWMSQLQTMAKPHLIPLINGGWSNPSEEGRRAIALWATMFTMVNEFADPETAAIPQEQRTEFMETLSIPHGWTIWAGRVDLGQDRHLGICNHFGRVVFSVNPQRLTRHSFQSTGFSVGSLFIQTIMHVPEHFDGVDDFIKHFDLRKIHPARGPLKGRFPVPMDRMGFYAVSNGFAAGLGMNAFYTP